MSFFRQTATYFTCALGILLCASNEALAGSRIVATYYRDGQMLVDDHEAELEVISSSNGNPMVGDLVRVIRWSDGTTTTITSINGETTMGGYPAEAYGVNYLGGRIYEAYCTDNSIGERVCYKFRGE